MGDMDSGNSGSLQSSSGGDDDYESSRGPAAVDSFSSFFTPPAPHVTLGSFLPSNHHPPSQPPPPQSYFDPLATYFDHLSRSSNPDPVWPKETQARPGPNSMPPSTSDHLNPSSSAAGKQGRNPRKRTRASRRAPTTVLTTDTSNFRAMVQEFTGIPSPPFGSSAASPSSLLFPRTRFDLFGNPRGGTGDAPPYLLRPLAQKLPIPPQQPNKNSSGDVMYPDLLFKYPDAGPGPSKPGPASGGGSLELPITIRPSNNNGSDQLGGITAGFVTASDGVSGSGGKSNGNGGPLVWAEGLGLGADAGAGGPSHHQPHNLGFAHQHIG